MKKYYKVFVLSIMAFACASLMFAQSSTSEEQLTAEQIRELIRIQKQEIRKAAKEFLADDLPELIAADPARADEALDGFIDVFNLLSDNELMYLYGHMWARIGEDDRAIAIFNTLLDSELNEGARKMLNLVLYRKLTGFLNAGDRKAAKDFLRFLVFENYNTERYFPTYLYIYADLNATDGNYEEAAKLIQNYNDNRDVVQKSILPMKHSVIARLDKMDFNPYFSNPNQTNFNKLNAEIEQIKVDLTGLYSFVMGMKGMIFVDALVRLHEQEMAQLDNLKKELADYANTTVRTEESLELPLSLIEGTRASLATIDKVLQLFDIHSRRVYDKLSSANPENVTAYKGDLQLDKLITNDKTIGIYRETLEEINKLLTSGAYPEHTSKLLADKRDLEQKLAEAELRNQIYIGSLEHSSSDEEQIFSEVLKEYEYYAQLRNTKKLTLDELEQLVRTEIRTTINQDMRDKIRPKVYDTVASVKQSTDRDRIFTSGFAEILPSMEFVRLQLSYRNLMSARQEFEQQQLPDNERLSRLAELRAQMQEMISDIQDFLTSNPSFTSIEQPGGGNLVGAADLYYSLAELQYESLPNDLLPALASYRKALQLDPNLPDRDLALYNIGFISSELKRLEVEASKDRYFSTGISADKRPMDTYYRSSDFAEAVNSYTEIVRDFPNSVMFDESVYRLGLLNFAFAEDAPTTEESEAFRTLALGYFDQLANKPTSPLHYDAIYQRGWVKLNVMDEDTLRSSMNDFMILLKAIESGLIENQTIAGDYKTDAIKNLAYCLIALDGTDFSSTSKGVAEIRNIFEGYTNSEVISQVVRQATINKRDLRTNLQALDFMRLTVDLAPFALENPTILDSMLIYYYSSSGSLREGDDINTIAQNIYQELITNYSQDTAWYKANIDKDIQPQLDKVENAYTQKGIMLYNKFGEQKSKDNLLAYQAFRQDFQDFLAVRTRDIAKFTSETDSIITDFYVAVADTKKDENSYIDAITQLYNYNTKYPSNPGYFNNEIGALSFSRDLFELSQSRFADPEYTPAPGLPQTLDEAFAGYQTAVFRYWDVVNQEPNNTTTNLSKALQNILVLAEIQNERGKFDEAASLYTRTLENESLLDSAAKRNVYLKLAVINGNTSKHLESEEWYRKALPFALNADDRTQITSGIRFQIEKSYEAAERSNNYVLEATERLRLAREFTETESDKVLGQKVAAHEAYLKAREFQKAIDLLMDIAQSDTSVDAIHSRYARAIEIASADSLMNNNEIALSLEQEYISKYPKSLQAFQMRLARLEELAKEPQLKYADAAEGFLSLHAEATNGDVTTGETQPSYLLQSAIINFAKAKNTEREYETLNQFIALYPNHQEVVPYMEYMAKGYLEQKDMQKYEAMAIALYKKDKTKSAPYQYLANEKLKEIAATFDAAYLNKDYTAAFAARDEFRKVETAYKREGLTFTTDETYKFFASVQEEYDNLQKRLAFLRNYDAQMANLEKSELITKTPAQLIVVNDKTTWDKNLDGKGKRIDLFSKLVKAETDKVVKVINQANSSGFDLDNSRKLRAMSLLANMNDKAYKVIETQINSYFTVSREGIAVVNSFSAEEKDANILYTVNRFAMPFLNQAFSWNADIYSKYWLAGYADQYTTASKEFMDSKNLTPDLKIDEYIMDSSWTLSLEESSLSLEARNITTPKNLTMGSLNIPDGSTLIAKKSTSTKIRPNFALLHVMYPLDIDIKVNGSIIEPAAIVPVDTLIVDKPATTRYAYFLGGEIFSDGENDIEISVTNTTSVSQQIALTLQYYTDKESIRKAIPPIVTNSHTNPGWKVITVNPSTSEETSSFAILAPNFGIPWESIQDIEPTPAQGIWVAESDSVLVNDVTFELDFFVETTFISGDIVFAAPETCSIVLNGATLIESIMFDFEPDPLEVFPSKFTIPADQVVKGKNTLRFKVNNTSIYRGFLASVTITQAGKEEVR